MKEYDLRVKSIGENNEELSTRVTIDADSLEEAIEKYNNKTKYVSYWDLNILNN